MDMTIADEEGRRHAAAVVDDLLAQMLPPDAAPAVRASMLQIVGTAVSAGYIAGQASKEPATDRLTLLADTIRATHEREQFGDCVEDGERFPCRTLRAVNIVVGPAQPAPFDDVA